MKSTLTSKTCHYCQFLLAKPAEIDNMKKWSSFLLIPKKKQLTWCKMYSCLQISVFITPINEKRDFSREMWRNIKQVKKSQLTCIDANYFNPCSTFSASHLTVGLKHLCCVHSFFYLSNWCVQEQRKKQINVNESETWSTFISRVVQALLYFHFHPPPFLWHWSHHCEVEKQPVLCTTSLAENIPHGKFGILDHEKGLPRYASHSFHCWRLTFSGIPWKVIHVDINIIRKRISFHHLHVPAARLAVRRSCATRSHVNSPAHRGLPTNRLCSQPSAGKWNLN